MKTKTEYLKNFDKKYQNIEKMLYNNIETLTEQQKEHITSDLQKIVDDIKEYGVFYRSHFKTLQTILKDAQFYEFLQNERID